VAQSCEHGNEFSGYTVGGEFLSASQELLCCVELRIIYAGTMLTGDFTIYNNIHHGKSYYSFIMTNVFQKNNKGK
jgi:hypothetical protein